MGLSHAPARASLEARRASSADRAWITVGRALPCRATGESILEGGGEHPGFEGAMALLRSGRMSEPAWKKLVEQLKSEGHRSPYLDRLRQRLPASGPSDLAGEILREMASALGRSEDKINVALLELELQGRALDDLARDRSADPRERAAMIAAFNRQREAAVQALWELRVHREALGFRRNDDLAALYPIPPKRA